MSSEVELLRLRVKELETEVSNRESDLSVFRNELAQVNSHLEVLISNISREIKLATQIQKTMVSVEFPNIPGFNLSSKFIPSMISGGDYLDIFEHQDKFRFGVVVSSSSGYSMSSLFLSVLLKFTAQMEARKGAEPDVIVRKMAEELIPSIGDADKADIFYALIERRTYQLNYCVAGQVLGFIQDHRHGEISPLQVENESIHRNFNQKLKLQTLKLQPKDRLIVCSRGVIEAKNLNEELFGADRLFKAISGAPKRGVHEMRNEILYQVEKFSSGVEVPRDMTVVVMEVKDGVIKLA